MVCVWVGVCVRERWGVGKGRGGVWGSENEYTYKHEGHYYTYKYKYYYKLGVKAFPTVKHLSCLTEKGKSIYIV